MPSVIPGTARYLAGLVSAEIGASPSSPLQEPEPDDPGRLLTGRGRDTRQVLRYLATLTGTSAGKTQSMARGWPGRGEEAHAPAS